jgi:uncharacterized RDD family membrane protein YckC
MSLQSQRVTPLSAFDNVRTARVISYVIDLAVVFLIQIVGFVAVTILVIPTLGLATFLYGPVFITPLIAMLYAGFTIGGPRQATYGQRIMGLVVVHRDGGAVDFLYAASHALLFYLSVAFLTPLVLAVSLFDREKRLLHDIVLGLSVRRARI